MSTFLGNYSHLTDEEIRSQALAKGYEEVSPMSAMRLAFMKGNRVLAIYVDGSVYSSEI